MQEITKNHELPSRGRPFLCSCASSVSALSALDRELCPWRPRALILQPDPAIENA
jgi:hypothetical protein